MNREPEYKVDRLNDLIRSLQQENLELLDEIQRLRDDREADARVMVGVEIVLFLVGIAVGLGIAVVL